MSCFALGALGPLTGACFLEPGEVGPAADAAEDTGQDTGPDDPTSVGSSGGSSGAAMSSTGLDDADDGATVADGSDDAATDGTTTEPPSVTEGSGSDTGVVVEVCDGIDNDGDGLVDEASSRNQVCDGCELAEIDGRALWACPGPVVWGFDAQCAVWGAEPAKLDTEDQFEWLKSHGSGDVSGTYFIGATDAAQEGEWRWSDGTLADFSDRFATAEPNGGTDQNCALVSHQEPAVGRGVNDYFCDEMLRFACSADLAE